MPYESNAALVERLNQNPPPIAQTLARRIVDASSAGEVTLVFDAPETLCNSDGALQGGVVAAMLDAAMGSAIRAASPDGAHPVTVEMAIRYFRPVRPGRVSVTGRIIHAGRRTVSVEGIVVDDAGRRLADARSTKMPATVA